MTGTGERCVTEVRPSQSARSTGCSSSSTSTPASTRPWTKVSARWGVNAWLPSRRSGTPGAAAAMARTRSSSSPGVGLPTFILRWRKPAATASRAMAAASSGGRRGIDRSELTVGVAPPHQRQSGRPQRAASASYSAASTAERPVGWSGSASRRRACQTRGRSMGSPISAAAPTARVCCRLSASSPVT